MNIDSQLNEHAATIQDNAGAIVLISMSQLEGPVVLQVKKCGHHRLVENHMHLNAIKVE